MVQRRGPFKLKVQLPPDDEDTEDSSEREVKRDDVNSSDSSLNGSSSTESEAKLKHKKERRKSDGNSSSSSSSSAEDNNVEKKTSEKKIKGVKKNSSSSSSNEEDSSASDPDSSEGESENDEDSSASDSGSNEGESESPQEKPRITEMLSNGKDKSVAKKQKILSKTKEKSATKVKKKKSGTKSLKRLKRMSMFACSSDENSGLEVAQSLGTKDAVKRVPDEDDPEVEMGIVKEEAPGSDTDSDEDYQPPAQVDEDEGSAKLKDDIVEDSDEGWRADEWEDEDMPTEGENDDEVCASDVAQAKFVMRNILSRVPLIEETAIHRGVKLSGPPLEFPTTHSDEYARKFRWPQHLRNLCNTNFSQDPSEILEDYEVLTIIQQPELGPNEQDVPKESPFAQVPRPIVALAAEALRRSSRKRKRPARSKNQEENSPSAAALLNISRIGGQFGDHFVESLLTANGKALQGILDCDFDYDKNCWASLPTKKKPIANWRFVLEHTRRNMEKLESGDAVYPPMKQETLERITKRLKTLYGYATQHEEYDVFAGAVTTTKKNATESTLEDQTSQNSE